LIGSRRRRSDGRDRKHGPKGSQRATSTPDHSGQDECERPTRCNAEATGPTRAPPRAARDGANAKTLVCPKMIRRRETTATIVPKKVRPGSVVTETSRVKHRESPTNSNRSLPPFQSKGKSSRAPLNHSPQARENGLWWAIANAAGLSCQHLYFSKTLPINQRPCGQPRANGTESRSLVPACLLCCDLLVGNYAPCPFSLCGRVHG